MLTSQEVPVTQSALLVIDAQDSFRAEAARWERRSNPHFERNVADLIAAYREAQLPVLFFLHIDEDEGFQPEDPLCKLMDFISPQVDEPVLSKRTRNCFTSTPLQSLLLEKAVRRLVITGYRQNNAARQRPVWRTTASGMRWISSRRRR